MSVIAFSAFLSLIGGYGLITGGFVAPGGFLLVSTLFLSASFIIATFKKYILPIILNIIGSMCYLYTLGFLADFESRHAVSQTIETLYSRHLLNAVVTVLLAVLCFLNFFSDEAVKKRLDKKKRRESIKNAKLSDDEKIV